MEQKSLERKLKPRHVEMIALGGHDWGRPFYGFRQHNSNGRAVSAVMLCLGGFCHVFDHAYYG